MKGRTPRGFRPAEARRKYLKQFLAEARYWADLPGKTARERTEGLVFSLLATLDGESLELPAVDLMVSPHPDDEEFLRSRGENWFVAGQKINGGVALHEEFVKLR